MSVGGVMNPDSLLLDNRPGALVAHRDNEHWQVEVVSAPHIGERPEKD